jgi:hypothetical protein
VSLQGLKRLRPIFPTMDIGAVSEMEIVVEPHGGKGEGEKAQFSMFNYQGIFNNRQPSNH